ncbi:MAG: glutathione S-transferase family protein [Polyangiales bacterium]
MITLYHTPKTRSSRFIWLLEEIGEPYEVKLVSIRGREGHREDPDYRRIHPHGKVPALVHDGATVFESAAIALYLGDAFPRSRVGVPVGDPLRGPYVTWLAYYAGAMEPAFVGKALGFATTNSTTGWASTEDTLAYVTATLAKGPYLLGDQFTTADVLLGSTFALFRGSPLMPANPVITAYVERLTTRPAYVRAAARDEG